MFNQYENIKERQTALLQGLCAGLFPCYKRNMKLSSTHIIPVTFEEFDCFC